MNKYEAVCLWIICVFQNQIYDDMELTVSLYKIKNYKKKKKSVKVLFKTKEEYLCVINSFHSAPLCEIQTCISSKISLKD